MLLTSLLQKRGRKPSEVKRSLMTEDLCRE